MFKELATWESSSQILDHEGMLTFKETPIKLTLKPKPNNDPVLLPKLAIKTYSPTRFWTMIVKPKFQDCNGGTI